MDVLLSCFILLQALSLCGATEYYVRPTEPTNTSCPGQPCLTMDQYTNDPDRYFKSNTVFKFLSGTHKLIRPVRMEGVCNVSLQAYVHDPYNNAYSYPLLLGWFSGHLTDCSRSNEADQCSILRFNNVHNISMKGIRLNVLLQRGIGIAIKQSSSVFIEVSIACFQNETEGIAVEQASLVNIFSTTVSHCAYGIKLQNATSNVINKTSAMYNSICGLCLDVVSFTTVQSMVAIGNGIGILSNRTVQSSIIDTDAWNNTESGMELEQTNSSQITGSTVSLNGNFGMTILCSRNTSIASTLATSNIGEGILLIKSTSILLRNTTAAGNFKYGVRLTETTNAHLTQTAILNSLTGLYVSSSENTTLHSNTVVNCSKNGIIILGSKTTYISETFVTNTTNYGLIVNLSNNTQIFVTKTLCTYIGIVLHNATNTSILHTTSLYTWGGVCLNDSANTLINYLIIDDSQRAGVSVRRSTNTVISNFDTGNRTTYYAIVLINANNSVISSANIRCSLHTYVGIYLFLARSTTISNTTVTSCHTIGIFLSGTVGTVIENTTALYSRMDILINDGMECQFSKLTLTSSATTLGLSIRFATNCNISDILFVQYNKPVNDTLKNRELRVNSAILLQYGTNVQFKMNFSEVNRGITVYKSINTKFIESTFNDISYPVTTSDADPATLPAVIVLYYSTIELRQTTFLRNNISCIKVLNSTVTLRGNLLFSENTASAGTAFLLLQDSNIRMAEASLVHFENNRALETGGVFYIDTNMYYSSIFRGNNLDVIPSTVCFLSVDEHPNARLSFTNNTAGRGGDIVYGGQIALGWVEQRNCFLNFMNASTISQSGLSLISSAPSRVCICDSNGQPDCLRVLDPIRRHIYPGQTINVSAVAVGQEFGTVSGSIFAQFFHLSTDTDTIQLQSWQYIQDVSKTECIQLSYSIFSKPLTSDIVLILSTSQKYISNIPSREIVDETIQLWNTSYYEWSGRNTSSITQLLYEYPVYINLSLYQCPPGFKLTDMSPYTCECSVLMQRLPGVRCYIQEVAVERSGSVWVGGKGYVTVSEHCPFNYCKKEKINVTLNDPDSQCNYNHAGTLCGQCQQGLSLALGSSKCLPCSNNYLALITPFLLAGLILVLFIKVIDLTISQGTINGLIFFANIVKANEYIFFAPDFYPFTIFISWLNLDLGIETCFFTGLSAYSKTWLQFAFPLYIWSIAGLIILMARLKYQFANAMGNNSVPVLATLFFLSYAKLFRTIITVMSYTVVNTSHGSKWVWSADGNLDYLGTKHAPLFAVAAIVLLFLWLPYTLFLCLGQFLYKCNCRLITRSMIKLKPFTDLHYNAFKSRHRYWFGMELILRAVILLATILIPNKSASISLLCIAIVSSVLTFCGQIVYQRLAVSIFNTLFYLNLTILGVATLFTILTTGGNQKAVSGTAIGIAFIQFFGLVIFKVLSITKYLKKMKTCLRKRINSEDDWEPYEQAALLREAGSDSESEEEIDRSPSMESLPTYGY